MKAPKYPAVNLDASHQGIARSRQTSSRAELIVAHFWKADTSVPKWPYMLEKSSQSRKTGVSAGGQLLGEQGKTGQISFFLYFVLMDAIKVETGN